MTASERRSLILNQLTGSDIPCSAAALARQFGVSRQIIVGDIALLRASGCNITATARGYLIPSGTGLTCQLACTQPAELTQEELYIMVDCGCTVIDVIVEHPVYGQLTAPLQLASRLDVDQFVENMANHSARPLSLLTEGIHLHTLSCPSQAALDRLKENLAQAGMLLEAQG